MNSEYLIEERVIQRAMEPYPDLPQIVDFSTPVVSFGYPHGAKVATVGINPSSNEFQIGNGNKNPLQIGEKRLVDTESLGLVNPKSLNRDQAIKVIKGCYSYFSDGFPYKWFDELQSHVLSPIGLNYKNGDACHLDLVQWATDPVWQDKKMPKAAKARLLSTDQDFLRFQLTNYDFKYVFLNGSTVVEQVEKLGLFKMTTVHEISFNSKGTMSCISEAELGSTTFIGWGLNIGYGATYSIGKQELSEWLSQNVSIN